MDKLDLMLKRQAELQEHLGVTSKLRTKADEQKYINQMLLAIHEETVEIMRETAYKNPDYVEFGWKKNQVFNSEGFKNELADLFHFVLNLVLISKMTSDELFTRYMDKNQENHERKNGGY